MATPEELQQDKDFLLASPGDQAAYLSDVDPDFKASSPAEQTQYLAHVMGNASQSAMPKPPQLEMQEDPGLTESRGDAGKLTGLPGVNPHKPTFQEGLGDAAFVATGAAGGMFGGGAAKAAIPYIAPTIATYGIERAKELPVVGPIIKRIPFIELLPWLAMGGKGKAAATEVEAAEAGAVAKTPISGNAPKGSPIYRDATLNRRNIPEYAGEEGPLGRIETVAPAPPKVAPTEIAKPIQRGSRADLMEDKGIQESMQHDLEGHGIQARKQTANEAAQYRIKPIRQARSGQISTDIEQAKPEEDMTEILQQSLDDARKKRPRK